LLRILAGRAEPKAGKVLWAADLRIGYLSQDPFAARAADGHLILS